MNPEFPRGDYQDRAHEAQFVLWSGISGTGKTTHAIERMKSDKPRFKFVFDHEGQVADELGAYLCTTADECRRAIAGGCCLFDPTEMFDGNLHAGFEWFAQWVWNFSCSYRGTKSFWADEINDYIPHAPAKFEVHPMQRIMGRGRRRGIRFFGISPALQLLNTTFRMQFTEIYAFQNPDPQCADFLVQRGVPFEQLERLRDGEFIHLDVKRRIIKPGKVKLPT